MPSLELGRRFAMPRFQSARIRLTIAAVFYEGSLALLALLWLWWSGATVDRLIQLTWTALALGAIATLPLLVLLVAMTRWPIGPLRPQKRLMLEQIMPLFEG